MSNDWSDTAFFAVCEPVESKPVTDVRHHPTPRPTEFKAVHSPDMKFIEVPNNVSMLLGYEPEELVNTSWYQWIFPEDLNQARQQHMKFVKEEGSAFACVVRMICKNGDLVWVDIIAEKSQETISNTFVCSYIIIEEDEVPYYRLHHNLLPFPEHYSEIKRRYLASHSSLLASSLNTDTGMASPSGMASPNSGRHPQSPGGGNMSHMLISPQGYLGDNMDTKTILRRQLKRKLGVSMDSALSAAGALSPGSYATGMEIFNIPPPNKMMMRRHTASDLLYPTAGPGVYPPSLHPSAYEMAPQHMYMPPPPPLLNDSSMLMHPTQHFRGEYTAISHRPIDLPIHPETYSPGSPRTVESPMLRQSNQNNNVRIPERYPSNLNEFQSSPPPLAKPAYNPSAKSSPVTSDDYLMNEPPRLNHAHSPPIPVTDSPMCSPQRHDVITSSPENYYCDTTMMNGQSDPMATSSCAVKNSMAMTSPISTGGNYSPVNSGYGSPVECVTSCSNGPIDHDLTNLISSYENQFEEKQPVKSFQSTPQFYSCSVRSPQSSPQHFPNTLSPQAPNSLYQPCSSPQHSMKPLGSQCGAQMSTQYSRRTSSDAGSPPSCEMEMKPYQLQYSITPHPPSRGDFPHKSQRRFANERNGDWMRKYSHMSAMEMLLSDSETHSSYYG